MVELLVVVAVVLLLAGVVGSFLPLVPSGLLSLAGLYAYVVFADEPEIGGLLLALLTLIGIAAALLEHFAGAIAARASGASTRTMLYAAVAGVALFVVTGPIGILLGILGVVFLSELNEGSEPGVAARRALYTLVGVLGSSVIQFLLTLTILIGFVLAVAFF